MAAWLTLFGHGANRFQDGGLADAFRSNGRTASRRPHPRLACRTPGGERDLPPVPVVNRGQVCCPVLRASAPKAVQSVFG